MLAPFIGVIIGLVIGICDLSVTGGGIVGALGTIIGVAILAFTAVCNLIFS